MIERATDTERATEFGSTVFDAFPTESLPSAEADLQTGGQMLRQAREIRGLDELTLALALKVSVEKIRALEADDYEAFSEPVFARALAASVCRTLRIDPGPVLERLPAPPQTGVGIVEQPSVEATFQARSLNLFSGQRLPSKPLLIVVVLLLLAAAAILLAPQTVFDRVQERLSALKSHYVARMSTTTDAPKPADQSPLEASTMTTDPASVTAPPPSSSSSSSSSSPPPPAAPASPAAPAAREALVPVASEEEAPTSAMSTHAVPAFGAGNAAVPAQDGQGALTLSARAQTWVSVTDGTGKVALRRSLAMGETVGLDGIPPLSVTIGHAADVDVRVRGQPFDLSKFTAPGGVARFEVRP